MLFSKQNLSGLFSQFYTILSDFEKALIQALSTTMTNLESVLNGGLSFSENMDCKLVSYTTNVAPNTEDTVAHGLGKVPTGFLIYSEDKAAVIYDSGTAWTKTNIYLKCDTASVAAKLIIF